MYNRLSVLTWMIYLVLSLKAPGRHAFVLPTNPALMTFVPNLQLVKCAMFFGDNFFGGSDKSKKEGSKDADGWEYLSLENARKLNPDLQEMVTDENGVSWFYSAQPGKGANKAYRRRRIENNYASQWESVDSASMGEVTIDEATGQAYVTDEDGNVWAYTYDDNEQNAPYIVDVDTQDIQKYRPSIDGIVTDENGEQWKYFVDEEAMSNDNLDWQEVNEDDLRENNPELGAVIQDKDGNEWVYFEEEEAQNY